MREIAAELNILKASNHNILLEILGMWRVATWLVLKQLLDEREFRKSLAFDLIFKAINLKIRMRFFGVIFYPL